MQGDLTLGYLAQLKSRNERIDQRRRERTAATRNRDFDHLHLERCIAMFNRRSRGDAEADASTFPAKPKPQVLNQPQPIQIPCRNRRNHTQVKSLFSRVISGG